MVPEPVNDDARAAYGLAVSVLARGSGVVAVEGAGLLDETLPWVVRVEVARACGRSSCATWLAYVDDPLWAAAVLGGAGEAVAEVGMAYAREREAFGRPLARMPVQRYAFASVAAGVEACVALVRRVAAARDAGGAAALDEAAVLPYARDAAWAAAEAALQVHGGYGYTDDYPVSRMWREIAAARVVPL